MAEPGKTALLCGATGLVGGECLKVLVEDDYYRQIVVLTRRDLGEIGRQGKVRQHILDFEELERYKELVAADHVFCALGTTMRKAGSRQRFRRVDFEYPLQIARMALANGARHFSLVSSLGANPKSRTFYLRVKGEVEEAICGLGFPSVAILRPSLLVGERAEVRLGERIGRLLLPLAPAKYRPTPAVAVARAMVALAKEEAPGCRIVEARGVKTLGGHGRIPPDLSC